MGIARAALSLMAHDGSAQCAGTLAHADVVTLFHRIVDFGCVATSMPAVRAYKTKGMGDHRCAEVEEDSGGDASTGHP